LARIAVIDDDDALLDVLALALGDAGHQVVCARDGLEGANAIREQQPELVICDINMPRLDGFALVRKLRAAGNVVPIVLLTSRDSEIDEALGLELGAEDYVTKPFSTRILMARVAALLRREQLRSGAVNHAVALKAGALALDAERLEVTYRGKAVTTTVSEFKLLEALARRPGVVFSRERLLEQVRGDDSIVVDRIIDTYVRRLRRKLEAIDPQFAALETVIGAGYRWRSGDG
jgi:DNA-binding response OmpR family regulator